MSRTIGYTESIRCTSYRSFRIRTDGPTIFTEADLDGDPISDGDIWIQPTFLAQRINGQWVYIGTNLSNSIIYTPPANAHYISNATSFNNADFILDNTISNISNTISNTLHSSMINISNSGTYSLGTVNGTVTRLKVNVVSTLGNTSTMSIGTISNTSQLASSTNIDTANSALYIIECGQYYNNSNVLVTVTNSVSGSSTVYMEYMTNY